MFYFLIKIISHKIETPLTYSSEEKLASSTFVFVKIRNQNAYGIVIKETVQPEYFTVSAISSFITLNTEYKNFLKLVSQYYALSEEELLRKFFSFQQTKKIKTNDVQHEKITKIELNKEQQKVFDDIITLSTKESKIYLLQGVTGAGKTYLFAKVIYYYYQNLKKSVLFLCPNTHLAHTIAQSFKELYPTLPFFEYHSQAPKEERNQVWEHIQRKIACIVIGVHLPTFLPLENIGICILDEEHDTGYQENRFPYINSKESLLLRAQIGNIPAVLSSATPSITSIFKVKQGEYREGILKTRFFHTNLPIITALTIKDKKEIISSELEEKIQEALEKKEQVLLFIQRKGFFLQAFCPTCHFRFNCSKCSNALIIYENHLGRCHRCDEKKTIAEFCPRCKEKTKIKKTGCGINQLYKKIKELFPQAKVKQIESDLLKKKDESQKIVNDINNGTYDIIIGTQVITKGYNFLNISLVGIICADALLQIPFYRNTEEMIQQIIQVSGRSGRKELQSKVIIQSFSDHGLERFFEEKNYSAYVENELSYRKMLDLPPFKRISIVLIKGREKKTVESISEKIFLALSEHQKQKKNIQIFEPQQPLHEKVKNNYYRQIYIKGNNYSDIIFLIKEITEYYKKEKKLKIAYIPNPILSFYE